MDFRVGDRVNVKGHWNFPNDCTGVISEPPESATRIAGSDEWTGLHRFVKGRDGLIEYYWITFDESQTDGDGDGPYSAAEIEAEYLSRAG